MKDLFKEDFQPMLLKEIDKPFNSKEYIYELKLDGERALIFVNEDSIVVKTRNKKNVTNKFPELESIKKIVNKDVIFDGEIVAFFDGRPNFSELAKRAHLKEQSKIKYQSQIKPVTFVCFDILYENKNLIELPLEKRKEILNKYKDTDVFVKNKYIKEYGKELFREIRKLNLEGVIAKKIDSPYLINERSSNWLKIKNLKREEFYIIGYKEKESNYVISVYLAEENNKSLVFVGKASLAKKSSLYQKIINAKHIEKIQVLGINEKFIYIKPTIKCFVSYLERTPNNHLRQPIIK